MIRRIALLAWILGFCFGCAPKYQRYAARYEFGTKEEPDYRSLLYWAAHPGKYDPSDSIPSPLQNSSRFDSTIDVFFVHPTTFTGRSDERWNAQIDDATLNAKTDYSTILFQASAFNQARVFAPRYRQANLKAYFTTDTARAVKAFDSAYGDVRKAFQYYLEAFNQGHPIIIASHSQGSSHATRLLQEFFDGKPLQQKLVVAYIIGMNIPLNSFTNLQPCLDSLSTGCFCGWRTFKRGHEPDLAAKYRQSFVTNPLTWTTNDAYAGRHLNKGGVLRNFNKVYPHVADAQIHKNVLWANRPHFPGSFLYRTSNYHIGDINLFYLNIRANMQTRIGEYTKKLLNQQDHY
jgi:hypothetical protein